MTETDRERIFAAIDRFRGRRIAVAGDLMLDHYVIGVVQRISPEGPVPVLRVEEETDTPGGAANVAVNLAALGADISLVGVVGADAAGRRLVEQLGQRGIDTSGILVEPGRATITKERLMTRRQLIARCDRESTDPPSAATRAALVDAARAAIARSDAAIASDYAKGVLVPELLEVIAAAGRARGIPTLADPKAASFDRYRGFDFVTPNEKEFHEAFNASLDSRPALVERVGTEVAAKDWRSVVVTRGERGVALIGPDGVHDIAGHRVEVFDVVGAGDTFISSFALALAAGLGRDDAAALANLAASIVVGKTGTATVSSDELRGGLLRLGGPLHGAADSALKIVDLPAARRRVEAARREGKTVAFTNGCFDVLHVGHLHVLREARRTAELLVVAVNSDASVRGLKGPDRPIFREADRLAMLAAYPFVDLVLAFEEPTPLRVIEALEPDVLVKGADYTVDHIVGADVVTRRGGRVHRVELVAGRSSSAAIAGGRDKG